MDGRMEANQDAEFVIGWEAGEMLVASVVGSQHEVVASVHRADTGAEIPDSTPDHSFWINRLPQSIGYLVVLHGTSEPTDYNLLSAFLANLSSVRFHRRSTFRASMCRQMESCRICFRQAEWSMCFMASAWACCARDRGVHQNTSAPKSIAIVRKEDAPPRLLRLTA
jgi:hypothetical protein